METLHDKIKNLEAQLAVSNAAFISMIDDNSDGILIIDRNKIIVYANYTAVQLFDRRMDDLVGIPLDLSLNKADLKNVKITGKDGSIAVVDVNATEIEWHAESCMALTFRNITVHKKSEAILKYLSNHDHLTELPNRLFFEERLSFATEEAKATDQHIALLYLDLDNFKTINDHLGHNAGDKILQEAAHRLKQTIRHGDTVARLGGDEFAVILRSLRKPEYAAIVSENILNQLAKPIELNGREIFINASIGIAIYPFAGTKPAELIQNADTAMYNAKKKGRNQYRYFSEHLEALHEHSLQILNGLRNAVHNKELFFEYQPIIDMCSFTCYSVEALLRWQHPKLGVLALGKFLPFVKDYEILLTMTRWIIQRTLADYDALKIKPPFISINLSSNALDRIKIAETIMDTINKLSIKPDNIILELTETAVMKHPEELLKKFKQLDKMGIRIAIDDYGTGYSSLNHIKQLPLSLLKMDKTFISDVTKNNHDAAIMKSTIQLAHNLGLKVISEGVETKVQLDFLKAHDCDYIQGFYFARPMTIKALATYLTNS